MEKPVKRPTLPGRPHPFLKLFFFIVLSLSAPGQDLHAELQDERLAQSGRWFTYGGKPIYMVGIDMQSIATQLPRGMSKDWDGDYTKVLTQLQRGGFNKIRIWASNWFIAPDKVLQPFKRLASGRYDLEQWNEAYWKRLKEFVRAAKQRGIFVEYCLFSQYPVAESWKKPANYWNPSFNINDTPQDGDGDGSGYREFFVPKDSPPDRAAAQLRRFQEALVTRAVDELNPCGNVFFQILNEPMDKDFGDVLIPWTKSMADLVHKKGGLACVNSEAHKDMKSLQGYSDSRTIAIMGSNSYTGDPGRVARRLAPWQKSGRILQCSESFNHRSHLARTCREAWGWAMSGGYYAFYNDDRSFGVFSTEEGLKTARVASTLRRTMESVPFWTMSPLDPHGNPAEVMVKDGPTRSWQVLAREGQCYLVYFWGKVKSPGKVLLVLSPGTWHYRWIDPRQGRIVGEGRIDVNRMRGLIKSPSTRDWSEKFGLTLRVVRASNASRESNPEDS